MSNIRKPQFGPLDEDTAFYDVDGSETDLNQTDQTERTRQLPKQENSGIRSPLPSSGIRTPALQVDLESGDTQKVFEREDPRIIEDSSAGFSEDTTVFDPEGDLDSGIEQGELERQEYYSRENVTERYGLTQQSQQTKRNHLLQTSHNFLRTGLGNGNLDLDSQIMTGARTYHLKGYTTVDKIKREFRRENREKKIRNILTILVIIIFVAIMLVIYNPIKDISEWRKILGLDSIYAEQTTADNGIENTIAYVEGNILPAETVTPAK